MYVAAWRRMTDRSWMYFIPRASIDFVNGSMEFLEFAEEDVNKRGAKNICCPVCYL